MLVFKQSHDLQELVLVDLKQKLFDNEELVWKPKQICIL